MNYLDFKILYGSQTGTAKFAAEELCRELSKYDFNTVVMSLEDYDFLNLPEENMIIFIVATTGKVIFNIGYGEPPSSMKKIWQFLLRKDLPNDSLCTLNYTIFGLGDSSYEKFNQVAIVMDKRLESLGADIFYPVGLGDDQQDFGYETEFDPWCEGLIDVLKMYFPDKKKIRENYIHKPKFDIKYLKDNFSENNKNNSNNNKGLVCTIEELKAITSADAYRQVYHLVLSHNIQYNSNVGDVAVLYPKNSEISVNQMLEIYNLNKDDMLEITPDELIPKYITAFDLFESYVDINGIPNRFFCSIAALYTDNEIHKEKLELFSSKTSVIESFT